MKKPIQITEIKEYRKIEKSSVECDGCGLPATLNADRLCSHCVISPRGVVNNPSIAGRVWQIFRPQPFEPMTTPFKG